MRELQASEPVGLDKYGSVNHCMESGEKQVIRKSVRGAVHMGNVVHKNFRGKAGVGFSDYIPTI